MKDWIRAGNLFFLLVESLPSPKETPQRSFDMPFDFLAIPSSLCLKIILKILMYRCLTEQIAWLRNPTTHTHTHTSSRRYLPEECSSASYWLLLRTAVWHLKASQMFLSVWNGGDITCYSVTSADTLGTRTNRCQFLIQHLDGTILLSSARAFSSRSCPSPICFARFSPSVLFCEGAR